MTLVMPMSVKNKNKKMLKFRSIVVDENIQNMTQAHDTALSIAQERGLVYLDKYRSS